MTTEHSQSYRRTAMMKVNVSDNDVEQSTELLDDDFLQLLLTHNWPVVAQAYIGQRGG